MKSHILIKEIPVMIFHIFIFLFISIKFIFTASGKISLSDEFYCNSRFFAVAQPVGRRGSSLSHRKDGKGQNRDVKKVEGRCRKGKEEEEEKHEDVNGKVLSKELKHCIRMAGSAGGAVNVRVCLTTVTLFPSRPRAVIELKLPWSHVRRVLSSLTLLNIAGFLRILRFPTK